MFFGVFKQIKLNTIIELLTLRVIINYLYNYYDLFLSDELIIFVLVIVFLYIINKIIKKEFWNYVRLVIVYRLIIDILLFIFIFTLYKFNTELFWTLAVYFTPSLLGSIYLLDISYFNSIFLRSVENAPSILDNLNKYLSRKPPEIVKLDHIKPLKKVIVKEAYLKFKDTIVFKANLHNFNYFITKNFKAISYYRSNLNELVKTIHLYNYFLHLLENQTGSKDVIHLSIPGKIAISPELYSDLDLYYRGKYFNFKVKHLRVVWRQEFKDILFRLNSLDRIEDVSYCDRDELIAKVKDIIAANNAIITICYNRLVDSVTCFAITNDNKFIYFANSNKLSSYKYYFSGVFHNHKSNMFHGKHPSQFFQANIPNILKKTFTHEKGLR